MCFFEKSSHFTTINSNMVWRFSSHKKNHTTQQTLNSSACDLFDLGLLILQILDVGRPYDLRATFSKLSMEEIQVQLQEYESLGKVVLLLSIGCISNF
jgi:hypothetical protein